VVDGRAKLEKRKLEWKLFWEVDIKKELEALIGTALRAFDQELPVVQIFLESGDDPSK
jgi:hypothetical protein